MKLATLLLTLSVPLALAMGCGGGGDNAAKDSAACKAAGSCGGADGGGNQNDSGKMDTGKKSGLVVAKVPDGFVGDFYFGNDLVCVGKSSCEASVAGLITVEFKCPKHLFLTKTAYIDGEDVTFSWDKPGDWGLAPQGTYRDEAAKFDGEIKTWVENTKILLDFAGSVIGAVSGDKFAWTSEAGTTYNGTISTDLKTISFHQGGAGMNEFDVVLMLVE